MEDFDVLPSPTLAYLFAPQSFDQVVPDMITTPIIISEDESDDVAVPTPIIIISDDDTESDDVVMEVSSVEPPMPKVGTPSISYGSPPLQAFELPISPTSPGLPELTLILGIDEEYELETGWLTLLYQPMECIGDGEDDPLLHYPKGMVVDEPLTQPMESPYYHPIHEIGEPYIFPTMETDMKGLPLPHTIHEIGDPSIFPTMETATTELPFPHMMYETGEPSSFPAMGEAYVPGGSTSFGDPYAPQSFHYGEGSDMFTGVGDTYVDPHGYP